MNKKLLIFILVLFALSTNLVYSADSYRINSGSSQSIDEHGTKKKIKNSCSLDYFIPTRIITSWSSGSAAFLNSVHTSCISNLTCTPGNQTFYFTGTNETFEINEGCSYLDVYLEGGGGGGGSALYGAMGSGGTGANINATFTDLSGTLKILVGEKGRAGCRSCSNSEGLGGKSGNSSSGGDGGATNDGGGGGGGASAIFLDTQLLIIAGGGGGGGCGSSGSGGNGGGTYLSGLAGGGANANPGTAASNITGGSGGITGGLSGAYLLGGRAGRTNAYCDGGGGGGGYYGGGGGGSNTVNGGGGGGGSNYINSTATNITVVQGTTGGIGSGNSNGDDGIIYLKWY